MAGNSLLTKKILFLYPDPPGFSGQRQASELVLQAVSEEMEFVCYPVKLPGVPKTGATPISLIRFLLLSCVALMQIIWISLFSKPTGVFVAISQTKRTLTRESILLSMIQALSRKKQLKLACRLDSSLFTTWPNDADLAHQLKSVLKRFDIVAALGPTQKSILVNSYDLDEQCVRVVPNACEVRCLTPDEIIAKHSSNQPTQVLHLSSLMEPKGYVHLIQAIEQIDEQIHVTVCGALTQTEYDRRFSDLVQAESFLQDATSARSNLTWKRGAVGAEKQKLFEQSHLFVLPTWYPVESQPLVLLEAMASGCTIISTDIGEIPFMLNDANAVTLKDVESTTIANAIQTLHNAPELRCKLAIAARQTLQDRFSIAAFWINWQTVFRDVYQS